MNEPIATDAEAANEATKAHNDDEATLATIPDPESLTISASDVLNPNKPNPVEHQELVADLAEAEPEARIATGTVTAEDAAAQKAAEAEEQAEYEKEKAEDAADDAADEIETTTKTETTETYFGEEKKD